jgi:hypothetical protein
MLTLTGRVMKMYQTPARTDRATGEVTAPKTKAQIVGEVPTASGETKLEIVELNVTDGAPAFNAALGKMVCVHVAQYNVEGNSGLYWRKGTKVELVEESAERGGKRAA